MNKFSSYSLIFIFALLSIIACKNEPASLFSGNNILMDLQKDYEATPTPTTANSLLREVLQTINSSELSDEKNKSYLDYGYNISKKEGMKSRQAAFLFPLVKSSLGTEGIENKLFELANLMKSLNKPTASNTLYRGIIDNYPNYEKIAEAQSSMSLQIDSINNYIADLGRKIFEQADNSGINRNAALAYVDGCEAYALAYPDSPEAAGNLFKAAEVAKSIRTFPKSLSLYDWILDKYPNYEKASTSLFLKGFIIENSLGDDELAREVYNEFLQKHPKHDLADDVEFLIQNLGKTDEEILQMIESKRKENTGE